ncbi:LacI family DNA-binding transcriptional regulator [Sphingomonas sp. FW199]|uniref:LacI family DNA-binding transcriptional regulator n=1 Tax=Sphingomonas sp. FW199 TaxID=3400217 RepID=UPI003CE99101
MARRKQSVTIRHVAADAGVSLQTVSRFINGDAHVRPEVGERVRAAIDRLGYVPSIAARRMAGSRSYLIMALNDRERTIAGWRARDGTDWVDQMLLGGMLKCAEYGYRLIVELIDTHSDHVEHELRSAIVAVRPDGVILTPPHSQNQTILALLDKHRISIARIGSAVPGPGIPLTMEDERAASEATTSLAALGHRRIGFIAGLADYELIRWRIDGWRAGMAAAGLDPSDLLAWGDFSEASGREAARQLIGQAGATALIVSNDQMTRGAMAHAAEQGLHVPQDLSMVCFGGTPIIRALYPDMTTVDQSVPALTARAVELIIAQQRGEPLPEAPVVIPMTINWRGSVAAPSAQPLER